METLINFSQNLSYKLKLRKKNRRFLQSYIHSKKENQDPETRVGISILVKKGIENKF